VLEDVGVLATGKQMVPDPTGKPTAVSVVTLLVTPDDSRKVALAQQKGVVHLALRNGGDHGTADHKTTYLSDLTGVMPDVEIRPAHAKKAEKKRAEESSLQHLEVVRGTKTSTQTYRNNVQVEESMAAQPVGGISK
jgi:pilus assembly protein CpaB